MYYYKFLKIVYEKTTYKKTIFVNEKLLISITYFHKLKNKLNTNGTLN
jgi:hypothetical protein